MPQEIALLLTGCVSDLSASLRALQLAARINGRVHVLRLSGDRTGSRLLPGDSARQDDYLDIFTLITWISENEGIRVDFHLLEDESDKILPEFLRRHDISCLVAGAVDRQNLVEKSDWIQGVHSRLGSDRFWFRRSLLVLYTLPWDDTAFDQALRQFRGNSTSQRTAH